MADITRLAEALAKAQAIQDSKRKTRWRKVSPIITANSFLIRLNLRLLSNHIALGERFSKTLQAMQQTQTQPVSRTSITE